MKPLAAGNIETLSPYHPGKSVEQLERELGISGAVKLASNENPLGPSPRAIEAARGAALAVHRYPDDAAFELRHRIATFWNVGFDEVALGHGSNELIDLISRTFATPSDHAVIGTPSFSCYALSLQAANVSSTSVPLRDGLFLELPRLREAVRPETKLIFLDTPGNPTSTHIPAPELCAFLKELPDDIVVVVDEAYAEFATAPDFASALTMRHARERLIVLRTFSKAYGLAGLRVGYAVAQPTLIDYIMRVRLPFNANSVAQAAALAALDDSAHLACSIDLNTRERARLTDKLTAMGLAVAPSQTNFVTTDVHRPADAVYEALLRRGVIVRPFGPPLHRHLRISVGSPRDNDRLLEALPMALEQVRPGL